MNYDLTPDQIRAIHAKQQNPNTPLLHSSMLKSDNSGKLNEQKKDHLHKFASIAKKGLFQSGKTYSKIKNSKDKKDFIKERQLQNLDNQITGIADDTRISNSEKISGLQRLLNRNHKDMDQEMIGRIQMDLQRLHQKSQIRQPVQSYQSPQVDYSQSPHEEIYENPKADYYDPSDEHQPSAEEVMATASIVSQMRDKK